MPDTTMDGLTPAGPLTGTEILPMVQGGADRRDTLNSILAFVEGNYAGQTNLTASVNATTATILSDTGTSATIPAATTSDAGVMAAADKVKLNGIAAGATVNSSDAALLSRPNHTGTQALTTIGDVSITATNLNTLDDGANTSLHFHDADRARANHTGTQSSATISDFSEAVDDRVAALLVAGTNIALTYNDVANTLTIDAAASAGQAGVQFQDEGSNLGTSGTATVLDFVGAGVTASRVGNTVTVTIAGGGGSGSGDFYYQSTAPVSPTPVVGSRWVDSDTGVEYTYIDDGTSSQWVEVGTSLDAIGGILPVINGGTGVTSLTALLTALLAGSSPVDLAADSKELRIGASADLRLYHDGTNSVIENDTGDLVLKANTELDLRELTTTVGSPAAGGAGALPATPLGYLNIKVDGVLRKFPYYA
jgi:hypothetical protein